MGIQQQMLCLTLHDQSPPWETPVCGDATHTEGREKLGAIAASFRAISRAGPWGATKDRSQKKYQHHIKSYKNYKNILKSYKNISNHIKTR